MADGEGTEEGGRCGPCRRVLGQAGADGCAEFTGHRGQVRLLVDHLVVPGRGRAVAEGGAARRLGEHHPQSEHVDRGGEHATAGELLGCQESRRADLQAGLGQGRTVQCARDAEIDDTRSVLRDDDVRGLEIAVDDPCSVDRLECLGQAGGQHRERVQGQRSDARQYRLQGGTGHEGRHQPGRLPLWVGVDHWRGVEASDPPRGRDFVGEPAPEPGLGAQLGTYDLDGDRTAGPGAAQVDHAHAPLAEPSHQPVAAIAERGGITRFERLHMSPVSHLAR